MFFRPVGLMMLASILILALSRLARAAAEKAPIRLSEVRRIISEQVRLGVLSVSPFAKSYVGILGVTERLTVIIFLGLNM